MLCFCEDTAAAEQHHLRSDNEESNEDDSSTSDESDDDDDDDDDSDSDDSESDYDGNANSLSPQHARRKSWLGKYLCTSYYYCYHHHRVCREYVITVINSIKSLVDEVFPSQLQWSGTQFDTLGFSLDQLWTVQGWTENPSLLTGLYVILLRTLCLRVMCTFSSYLTFGRLIKISIKFMLFKYFSARCFG